MNELPNAIKDMEEALRNKKLLSCEEVIQTGVTRAKATLTRWRKKGIGPAYIKIGGRFFYPTEHLIAWLRNGYVNPEEK